MDDQPDLAALVEVLGVGLAEGLVQLALLASGELLQGGAGELVMGRLERTSWACAASSSGWSAILRLSARAPHSQLSTTSECSSSTVPCLPSSRSWRTASASGSVFFSI